MCLHSLKRHAYSKGKVYYSQYQLNHINCLLCLNWWLAKMGIFFSIMPILASYKFKHKRQIMCIWPFARGHITTNYQHNCLVLKWDNWWQFMGVKTIQTALRLSGAVCWLLHQNIISVVLIFSFDLRKRWDFREKQSVVVTSFKMNLF